ncbi:MAG: hypothetical protein LBI79_04400 [Nitrososphaerota archaeon]|nr:hypothetical protein [Nitrososphaerota archaeon]
MVCSRKVAPRPFDISFTGNVKTIELHKTIAYQDITKFMFNKKGADTV